MNTLLDARFLKFGAVGIVGMSIDFSVTWICKEKLQFNKYIANSLGFCCSVMNNFLLNRYWTFGNNLQPFAALLAKFAMVSVSGLLINNFLLYLLVKYIKRDFYFLKLVVIGLVFFWNYFINVFFTFN